MNWKSIKKNKYYQFFSNKYVLISLFFIVWILFLDANAWFTSHYEIDKQIAEKEQNAAFFRKGIKRDSARISQLSTQKGLEKFARERYLMKKQNEEVFIIEHPDSVKHKENE
ncbi:septum formation initiator [Nonlabens sp. MIC269]|uniref:FtsB family cell division protein n=1 Tax=Nonlabens sp. MIC269 TaxID=1476901 RepID=UPI0007218C40|nr:septum formation initiator family protein [Nonlabens sp. MIC269]ALM19872.1 septum formation initiator [Nonlabens sp. MIC269]